MTIQQETGRQILNAICNPPPKLQLKWTRHRIHEIALMLAITDCEASIDAWANMTDPESLDIVRGHREFKAYLVKEQKLHSQYMVDAGNVAGLVNGMKAIQEWAENADGLNLERVLEIIQNVTKEHIAAAKNRGEYEDKTKCEKCGKTFVHHTQSSGYRCPGTTGSYEQNNWSPSK